MISKKKKSVIALAGILSAGGAMAQGYEPNIGVYKSMNQLEPAGISLEPFVITPWVAAGTGANDNVGLTDTGRVSSHFTVLSPGVSAALKGGTQSYVAKYFGNYGRYSSSSADNYNDHTLALDADNTWTGRASSHVRLDYVKGHDARNAVRQNSASERWHADTARGVMRYGAEGAQGQIDVEAGYGTKRYDTNTVATSLFDHNQRTLSGTFYYRLAPATQALVQVEDTHFGYESSLSSSLSSTERRYLVGIKWLATAKTSGTFKIGSMKKSFDSGTLPSDSDTTWEGTVRWSPLTYSIADFSVRRTTSETTGVGNFIVTRQEAVAWNHDWSSRVRSTISAENATDTFKGVTREDTRKNSGLKVSYGIQRWLRMGVEVQRQNRSSTAAGFSYTQCVKLLTLEGSL